MTRRCRLKNCPPGLFLSRDGHLGFKSEYADNTPHHGGDAYVVASGEYWWGGASTHKERGELMVTPIPNSAAVAAFASLLSPSHPESR